MYMHAYIYVYIYVQNLHTNMCTYNYVQISSCYKLNKLYIYIFITNICIYIQVYIYITTHMSSLISQGTPFLQQLFDLHQTHFRNPPVAWALASANSRVKCRTESYLECHTLGSSLRVLISDLYSRLQVLAKPRFSEWISSRGSRPQH